MKSASLSLLLLVLSFVSYGQCSPQPITGPTFVKVGSSITMYNSVTGGVWSVSDSGIAAISPTTGVLTGKTQGTLTVSYTMPGRCALFSSVYNVRVNPGIRGQGYACVGTNIALFDSASTTGVWSSGDTRYAVVNPTTGQVMGVQCGTTLISYSFTSATGSHCVASVPIIIYPGVIRPVNLYMGQYFTYSDTVAGGRWSVNDTALVSIDSVTGACAIKDTGTTWVTYNFSVAGIACTAVDTIKPLNNVGWLPFMCIADSTIFRYPVSGGIWSSSNASVATINSGTGSLRSLTPGGTYISYTMTNAAGTFVVTYPLNVTGVPTLSHWGHMEYCHGNRYVLPDASSSVFWTSSNPANLYIWSSRAFAYPTNYDTLPVTVTVRYGSLYCSYVRDSGTVSVNPRPRTAGTITGGARTLCPSDTTSVYSTGASDTTGYWDVSPSSLASITSRGQVTAASSLDGGVIIIWRSVVNSYGCSADTRRYDTVLGTTRVTSINGVRTLNIGLIGNYSSTGYGDSITWSVTPTSIATVSSTGQMTPLNLGTVTLKCVRRTRCGADSMSTTITIVPPATGRATATFIGYVNAYCSATQFGVNVFPHTATYTMRTYYGEGYCDTLTLAPSAGITISNYYHTYPVTGTYSVKQVLYNGASAIDSVTFSYAHRTCNSISMTFFMDADHDCVYRDTIDHLNGNPMRVEISKNGTPIDTIAVTSGLYYEEYGRVGDVFSYRLMSSSVIVSCPSSGIFRDTLTVASTTPRNRYIGVTCTSSGFDMLQFSTAKTGRHRQEVAVHVGNSRCLLEDGTLQITFDSRFRYDDAYPTPTSVAGNVVRWNFRGVSDVSGIAPDVFVGIETTGAWLAPGTLVNSTVKIIPSTGGDIDTTNNQTDRHDTVKSSYDPNSVSVSPAGNILSGTTLHYTVEFENDGNDTAHNIYIMDTLPDYVDVRSLQIEMASARMYTSIVNYGGHNIIKFDFPGIMLPDSSHHYVCRGRVMFNVKSRYGLVDGLSIANHAGIYFDDNPVVMTDTAVNTVLVPAISVSSTCRDTICHGGMIHCDATMRTVNRPHYQWYVNTRPVGADSSGFTSSTIVAGDNIRCVLRTTMDDTVYTTSNILNITERALPNPGTIHGASLVCPSATITLSDSVAGGTWRLTNSRASISTGGIVTGVSVGNDTAIYTVTNVCYPNSARFPFYVHPMPVAGTISGRSLFCDTSSTIMIDTASGGTWSVAGSHATISSTGRATGASAGADTVRYTVTNVCGTAIATFPIRLDSIVRVNTPAGASSVCNGDTIVLVPNVSGGSWTASNGRATISAAGVVRAIVTGADTMKYTVVNSCGTFAATKVVTVNPVLVPAVSISGAPTAAQCEGTVVHLSATTTNGGSAPGYSWQKFGTVIGAGATLDYAPAHGDIVICKLTSNATCRSADTVADTAAMPVIPAVTPTVAIVSSPSDTITYAGEAVTFYSTTTYGGSHPAFQWFLNGAAVSGATSISYNNSMNFGDQVNCIMTSDIACVTTSTGVSNTILIQGGYLSVDDHTKQVGGVSLFPNPSHGEITLSGKFGRSADVVFQVIDMAGKVATQGAIRSDKGMLNEKMNFNGLVPGRYALKLIDGGEVVVLNFVME